MANYDDLKKIIFGTKSPPGVIGEAGSSMSPAVINFVQVQRHIPTTAGNNSSIETIGNTGNNYLTGDSSQQESKIVGMPADTSIQPRNGSNQIALPNNNNICTTSIQPRTASIVSQVQVYIQHQQKLLVFNQEIQHTYSAKNYNLSIQPRNTTEEVIELLQILQELNQENQENQVLNQELLVQIQELQHTYSAKNYNTSTQPSTTTQEFNQKLQEFNQELQVCNQELQVFNQKLLVLSQELQQTYSAKKYNPSIQPRNGTNQIALPNDNNICTTNNSANTINKSSMTSANTINKSSMTSDQILPYIRQKISTGNSGRNSDILRNIGSKCNIGTIKSNSVVWEIGDSSTIGKIEDNCVIGRIGDYCKIKTIGNNCKIATIGNRCEIKKVKDNCLVGVVGNGCHIRRIGKDSNIEQTGSHCVIGSDSEPPLF